MKRVSKLLSVILVFALCFGLSSPALAMSIEPAPTAVSSTDTVLEKTRGSILVLRSEDLSNGDARISMLEGGEVVSSTYVDRSASQLIWEQYNANNVVMREVKIVSQAVQLPNIEPQAMTQWITVGDVRYNHYVQDALLAIPRITWSYRSEVNESGSFNIGGRYRDITTVVAFLASLLFIPASAASAIFLQVLTNLDTAASTAEIVIDDYYVSAVEEYVEWRAYAANKYKYYSGYKYIVTHEDFANQQFTEGQYYPTTAIADHNTSLALKPYDYFFSGHNRVEARSWPV